MQREGDLCAPSPFPAGPSAWGLSGLGEGPGVGDGSQTRALVSSSLLIYVQGLGFSHVFAQALGADLSVTGPT